MFTREWKLSLLERKKKKKKNKLNKNNDMNDAWILPACQG